MPSPKPGRAPSPHTVNAPPDTSYADDDWLDQNAEVQHMVQEYKQKRYKYQSKDSEVDSVHSSKHARSASVYSDRSDPDAKPVEEPEVKMSTHIDTYVNMINVFIGPGVLGLPYAFAQGGWMTLPLIAVLAVVCCGTAYMLGNIQKEVLQVTPPFYLPAELAGIYHRKRDRVSRKTLDGRVFTRTMPDGGVWEVKWVKARRMWDMYQVSGPELLDPEGQPIAGAAFDRPGDASPVASPVGEKTKLLHAPGRASGAGRQDGGAPQRSSIRSARSSRGSAKSEGPSQLVLVDRLEKYPDVAKAAFGKAGYIGIQAIYFIELFLYTLTFIIVGVQNVQHLTGSLTKIELIVIYCAVIMPQSFVREFSKLSFLGYIGFLGGFVVLFSLVFFGFYNTRTFDPEDASSGSLLHPADTSVFEPCTVPMSFALIMGSLSGHSMLPTLRADMYKPKKYSNVVFGSFMVFSTFYCVVGTLGYLMYGTAVKDIVIMNYDPSHPVAKVAVIVMTAVCVSKHGVPFNTLSLSLEELCLRCGAPDNWLMWGPVRLITTVLCGVVAAAIPNFHQVFGIVGAVNSSAISLILPLGAYAVLFRSRLSWAKYLAVLAGLVISLALAVTGTLASFDINLC